MFISDYFQLDKTQYEQMISKGVFDAILDKDNNFFINIIRLRESTVQEFKDAYQHINQHFRDVAVLLENSDIPSPKDKMYREARKRFCFHEVNGINLGFSKSHYGSGWGEVLSDSFLADAYQIVKKGLNQPEIFHLVSLFEKDVGPDRLSDMIATIIELEINKYTLRIMQELGITPETRPNLIFLKDGLVKNPNKKAPIQLLPKEILHKLPIAEGWDDIERVASENDIIRREISTVIGNEWERWASEDKKKYLLEHVFLDPGVCTRVINNYRTQTLDKYNFREDFDYLVNFLLQSFKKSLSLGHQENLPTSFEATHFIIELLKDWVENNRGWAEIQMAPSSNREKAVQRFMHLGAKYYVENNNLDFSCEPDEGRGPVDIKLSRGTDVTLAEIKLSSNEQYIHGFTTQIREYGKAERTQNLIYVFIDVGNPRRKNQLIRLYKKIQSSKQQYPELVIIDARPKASASTYLEES